eukprot:g15534.t1
MAPSHNRCIVRPSVAEFDETVRQIFEIFGEAMETSGPQLTKNLEVRRCLEKMLEQNEAGFRADMKQTDDWNECRLARIRAAVLTRRLMTQQLSLVEKLSMSRCAVVTPSRTNKTRRCSRKTPMRTEPKGPLTWWIRCFTSTRDRRHLLVPDAFGARPQVHQTASRKGLGSTFM